MDTVTGPYLQERWQALGNHPLVGEARGVGFLGALELVADKASRRQFDVVGEVGTLCRDACLRRGLVMRAVGDAMIISPPLIMSKAEIDELIDIASSALDETLDLVQNEE